MPERDRIIDLCNPLEVSPTVYPCDWKPRPGSVFVRMHPTASRSGILLGENSAAKADVATVQKSAVSWLAPGDIVVLRPYCGTSMADMGGPVGDWWKILGLRRYDERKAAWIGDTADWDVLMKWDGDEWQPLGGWQLVKRTPKTFSGLALIDGNHRAEGTVERGTMAGRYVSFYSDKDFSMHSTQLFFGMDSPGEEYALVHEDYLVRVEATA